MEDYRERGPPGNGKTRKTGASSLAAVRETARHVGIHASRVNFRGALYKDPGETQNVLFPETWVPKAALGQLGAHVVSLRKEPPIKPGTKDPYVPQK